MTHGNSEIQSAIPFANTGFFNKFLTVLTTLSAFKGPLSVDLEQCPIFLIFKKCWKMELYHSLPLSLFNWIGDRFDNVIIFKKFSVIVWEF